MNYDVLFDFMGYSYTVSAVYIPVYQRNSKNSDIKTVIYKQFGNNLLFADVVEGYSEFHLRDTKVQPFSAQIARPKTKLSKDLWIYFATDDSADKVDYPYVNPTWSFELKLPELLSNRIVLVRIRVSIEHYQNRYHAISGLKTSLSGGGPQPDIRVLTITDWASSFGKDSEYFLEAFAVLKIGVVAAKSDNRLVIRFEYRDSIAPPAENSPNLSNCREFLSCDINLYDFSMCRDDRLMLAIMEKQTYSLLPEIVRRQPQ